MRKTYVLDTSVLVDDPSTYKHFANSDVIIPITVLEELDKLKKQPNEVGKNSRVAIKLIDEISNLGDINTGILIENDILLKIDATYYNLNSEKFQKFGEPSYGDNKILACAYTTWENHQSHDVSLISNDINLRIKAKSFGIFAEGHNKGNVSFTDVYSGLQTCKCEEASMELYQLGFVDPLKYNIKLYPNECVIFTNESGDSLAMGKMNNEGKIVLIRKQSPWGISSRNKEQAFAIDLMMDKNIDLVTLTGMAGVGKSLITAAVGLELVANRKQYNKFIIYRPMVEVSSPVGHLPGTLEEKLAPWFQSTMDSFEVLFSNKGGGKFNDWQSKLKYFQDKGQIEMNAIAYIRGRSIPNAIMWIDEVQNLSKEEVKTILTRAGEGTKVILSGDISQCDAKDLDPINNGLTYTINKFKESELAAHITLTQGERSRLATLASEIL